MPNDWLCYLDYWLKSKMAARTVDMDAEVDKACDVLDQINTIIKDVTQHIIELRKKVNSGEYSTANGNSLLELKNHMMIFYLTNLVQLVSDRVQGKSFKDNPAIWRLCEIRVVLERIDPIEKRLQYQFDKLLQYANGKPGEKIVRPTHEDDMESDSDEDDDESDESDVEAGKGKPKSKAYYKPPMNNPTEFPGDATQKEKQEKLQERKKKRMQSAEMIQDLKEQYSEAPMEIYESVNLHTAKDNSKAEKEIQEYEEKYFVRLQPTKAQKKSANNANKFRTMSSFNSITNFGNLGFADDGDEGTSQKRKKSSGGKKGNKKRKFNKKR